MLKIIQKREKILKSDLDRMISDIEVDILTGVLKQRPMILVGPSPGILTFLLVLIKAVAFE